MSLADFLPILRRSRRAMTRTAVARVVVGVWLALHTLVIAAAPIVDARLGHAERVVAHWDDAQDRSCPPQHDPATCRLCQQVTAAFDDDGSDRVSPIAVVRTASVLSQELGFGARTIVRRGAESPRGPPTV